MALGYLQDEKKLKRKIIGEITSHMKEERISQTEMASYLLMKSQQAFAYKLANMTFDVWELKKIFEKLKFSDDEVLELMKGE